MGIFDDLLGQPYHFRNNRPMLATDNEYHLFVGESEKSACEAVTTTATGHVRTALNEQEARMWAAETGRRAVCGNCIKNLYRTEPNKNLPPAVLALFSKKGSK